MPFPDYSIAGDFGGSLDAYVFDQEVRAITFASANFQGLSISGDTVTTVFDVVPSAPDQALVDGAVAAYPTGTIPPRAEGISDFTSFSDPTASDDAIQGFGLLSRWMNVNTGISFVCTDNTPAAAVWKRTSNPTNVDPDYIDCFDISGGQNFTTTPTVILCDTTRTATNTSVLNRVGGTVQCLFDGAVKVTFEVSLGGATNRTSSAAWIELNSSEVQGTRSFGYHRNSSSNEDTLTSTCYLTVTNGNIIRGVSVRVGGSTTLTTIANGSRLLVERIS